MKNKAMLIAMVMLLSLTSACGGPELSPHIEPVLRAVFDAPNTDYFDPLAVNYLGEDTRTPEEKAASDEAALRVEENWEKLGEQHFAPNVMKSFLGSATTYMVQSLCAGDDPYLESCQVMAVELKEENEDLSIQTVTVTVRANDAEDFTFDIDFTLTDDGLIEKVYDYSDEEGYIVLLKLAK